MKIESSTNTRPIVRGSIHNNAAAYRNECKKENEEKKNTLAYKFWDSSIRLFTLGLYGLGDI